tara:strand:+ start:372 stop:548 length:177 start_codon:yes stop_codon:yes gene_type:complete
MKTFVIEVHHLNKIEFMKVKARDAEHARQRLEKGKTTEHVWSDFDKITPHVCSIEEEK